MTWYQLWKKIGIQPLRKTQNRKVVVYHKGMLYEAKMKYTNNGNYFFLKTGNTLLNYKIK